MSSSAPAAAITPHLDYTQVPSRLQKLPGPRLPEAALAAYHEHLGFPWADDDRAEGLVGDTVSSSGSGFGFVSGRCEVDGAGGVEGFLRCADGESGAQDGVFVAVVGG